MTYLLDVSPAEAVAAGAQLLDEKLPGWWQKITLEELQLNDCSACVCGQLAQTAVVEEFQYQAKANKKLFSEYDATLGFLDLVWNGVDELGDALGYDFEYGFNADTRGYHDGMTHAEQQEMDAASQRTYRALDHEWQLVIRARLEADKLEIAPRWREAFNPAEKDRSLA